MPAFTISIPKAAKRYGVSKQALMLAIRRGALPAMIIEVPEVRLAPKDVQAYVATIPEWRKINGRKGGLIRAAQMWGPSRLDRRRAARAQ